MISSQAAILPLVLATLLPACGAREDSTGQADADRPRVVLIGIDSADWSIIDPLIAAGDMPNLAGLKARAAWGNLATLKDIPLSPVIWTSVATGMVPTKHGVTWFLVDQPDGSRVPVRSTNRKTEALWTIADRAGRPTYALGWWATYPAESLEHGVIVSDALGFHGFGSTGRRGDDRGKVSPERLFGSFAALMPPEQQISASFVRRFIDISDEEFARERFDPAMGAVRNPMNPLHLFQQYAVTAQGYTRIAEEILKEDRYDLFLLYYEQVDSFSHLFMKYQSPRLPWASDRGVKRYSRVVREWYRYQDELLGRLLNRIDLGRTAVFIVSDHGFKSGDRRIRSEVVVDIAKAHLDHESEGIFLAVGPGIARGVEITGATVLDITPTVLHYLDIPVGKDMDGRVLDQILSDGLRTREIRYVPSHETGTPVNVPTFDAGAGGRVDTRDLEAGLRALGYIGDDVSDADVAPQSESSDAASSPEIHNNLGRAHLRRGELDRALAEFERALELDPRNADALLAISGVHRTLGRTQLAVHFIERALAVDPDSASALALLAGVLRDSGDLNEALRLYRAALSLTDADPGLHVSYGDVLQRAGDLEGAEGAFIHALELDPDNFAAYYDLGVVYGRMSRTDDAVQMYERALTVDSEHPLSSFVLNNLGAIHRDAGRTADALAAFDRASKLFPGHIESRFNAAAIHLAAGRVDLAIERLEEAAAIQPNHELVQQQLGLAYLSEGRADDARRALLLVRRLYPANWRASIGLAVLQVGAGQTEDARALLAEGRASGGEQASAFAAGFAELADL